MNKEKYFVASDGEVPLHIYFNSIEAFISKHMYIDSFDELGNKIKAYAFKIIEDEYIDIDDEYTEDF